MSDQSYEEAFAECQQAAIKAGALEPKEPLDHAKAGILSFMGKKWSDTPQSKKRLRDMTNACLRRKGFEAGDFNEELADCQRQAVAAKTLEPQGMGERASSGILYSQRGVHWSNTPIAQERYNAFVKRCMREKGYDV